MWYETEHFVGWIGGDELLTNEQADAIFQQCMVDPEDVRNG